LGDVRQFAREPALYELLDNYLANALEPTSMKSTNKHIKLNWDKLLGFNQVKIAQGDLKSKSGKAHIRAKIGQKTLGIKYVT